MKGCVYVTTIYFAYLESLQLIDKGFLKYAFDVTNAVDVLSAILNLVLVLKEDFLGDNVFYNFKT